MASSEHDLSETPPIGDDALIGIRVGEFVIERRLGEGGMGVVFAGTQPVIRKPVAIKVLQWEIARNPAEVDRLLAEARVVNAIRHRGIVDVISFGKLPDGRPYLVMELLEGEPLDAVVTRKAPMDVVEVADILIEVLEALGAAHEAGVIHRDLKPSNVFFVRPAYGAPYVKLLDFGLAKQAPQGTRLTPQTRASIVIGTPDYMAPEQARGKSISPETDLYAVGCMAFEMLTGRPPFEAPTVYEILTHHLNTPAPRVSSLAPGVPTALDDLVDRLLRKRAEERPSTAATVRAELQEIRAATAAAAPGLPAARPGATRSQRIEVAMAETLVAPGGRSGTGAPAGPTAATTGAVPPTVAQPGTAAPTLASAPTHEPASAAAAPTPIDARRAHRPARRMPAWALLVLALTVVVAASAGTIAWRSRRGSPPELRATPLGTTGPVAGVTSPVPAAVAGAPATAPPVRPAPTPPAPPAVTSPGATATPATTTPTTAAQTTPAVVPPPRTQAAPPVKQGSAPRSPRSPGGRAGAPASSPTAPLAPATPPPGTPPATGAAGDNEPASTATLIAQIEARLRALRAAKQSSGVDPLALQLLRDLRNRAATASTADDRRAIARDLREWQARYGSRGR